MFKIVVVHEKETVKKKKIRGHKRIWNDIDQWVDINKNLDLGYFKKYKRDYTKIRVHPWDITSWTKSQTPEPKGQTKTKILYGLIDIYDSWKKELDKLNETYYLRIWLFEPRFSNSQVVCAMGEYLDYYENIFFKPEESRILSPMSFGQLNKEIDEFNWEYRIDEDHFDKNEIGTTEAFISLKAFEKNKKRFNRIMKKPHMTTKYLDPIGEAMEYYSFKKGDVWLGEK